MLIQPIYNLNAKFADLGYFPGEKIPWVKSDNKLFMYWSGLKLEIFQVENLIFVNPQSEKKSILNYFQVKI